MTKPHADVSYLELVEAILTTGTQKHDRTGTGTKSIFGYQMRFDLTKGFPLLTTKKVHLKSVIYELLWFIQGSTNIEYLAKNGVRIWDDWPYASYKKSPEFKGETIQKFSEKIANDSQFAKKWGELGPVYGRQWRNWPTSDGEIDQIAELIKTLKENPDSRRIILSAWNVGEIEKMALPPCHCFFQFATREITLAQRKAMYCYKQEKALDYAENMTEEALDEAGIPKRFLDCQLYQRSCDVFLGVPFNIASYALFTMMVAQVVGMRAGEFIWTGGDTHLYLNHLEQAELQLSRKNDIRPMPKMEINPNVQNLEDFKFEDFELKEYDPHPHIKGEVSV